MKKRSKKRNIFITVITLIIVLTITYQNEIKTFLTEPLIENHTYTLNDIPKFSGKEYIQINDIEKIFVSS